MRHATPRALDALEPLLAELRRIPGLLERARGNFGRRAQPFLHFHEDPAGLFADVKIGRDWERWPVNGARERKALLRRARELAGAPRS